MNRLTKIIAAILMVLAIVLAALAWWMGRQPAVPERYAAPAPDVATYLAVAASRKLEKGRPITMDDVKLINSPVQLAGTYQDIASVVGSIPMVTMETDTLITEGNLAHGIALKLSDGERAVAIPVDETVGVGNKIQAGDYVDVFFTLKPSGEVEKGQARLLASRVRVLAYGANIVGETPAQSTLPVQSQQSAQARTAVLAASIDQINPLLLAMQNGKLTLALRHPGDAGTADATLFPQPGQVLPPRAGLSSTEKDALQSADNRAFSGVDLSSWSGGKGMRSNTTAPRRATPAGAATGTLEVIKGTQREKVHF